MRKTSLWVLLGAVCLALAGALIGCGGSGGDQTEGTTAAAPANLAKAVVARGNNICRIASQREDLVRQLAEDNGELDSDVSSAQRKKNVAKVTVYPYVTLIEEFEALGVTPAEAAAKTALIRSFKQRLAELEADPESTPSTGVAARYGLDRCDL